MIPSATALAALHALPDAAEERFIAMCDTYLDARQRYDRGEGQDGAGPLWEQIKGLEAEFEGWEPQTFPGLLKAAEMVRALGGPAGARSPWDSSFTDHWPETVVRTVLRFGGLA